MKAKKNVSERAQQPEALPPPIPKKMTLQELLPWQRDIVNLAEALQKTDSDDDIINTMLRRAIGLSQILEELAMRPTAGAGFPAEALVQTMVILQEQLQVVKFVAGGSSPLSLLY